MRISLIVAVLSSALLSLSHIPFFQDAIDINYSKLYMILSNIPCPLGIYRLQPSSFFVLYALYIKIELVCRIIENHIFLVNVELIVCTE